MTTRPIYLSFFMFETNARMFDADARALAIRHMKAMAGVGYAGFELHIGRDAEVEAAYPSVEDEVAAYAAFREEMDDAGLSEIEIATNVGATPDLDPSAAEAGVRDAGLAFLKSRVDVTAALRGTIMMGPVVIPYGAFIDGVWSDALQDALDVRYANAAPVLDAVGAHARDKGVSVAIEPITHWETPGPNTLAQTLAFLSKVSHSEIGVVIDSAHEVLDGAGPDVFAQQVKELAEAGRLHYAQASPPDRGGLASAWIPWGPLFGPLLKHYSGPVAVEVFNAIPAFAAGLRLSRRKYWIPEVDAESSTPSAYQTARSSLEKVRAELSRLEDDASGR